MTGETIDIRLHGRGGQGGVTCAKLLAAIYVRLGKSVQTFGDYAGERSGAPVRAYLRVSDREITSRNKVYAPHHLVVLDPTLLGADVVSGLAPGGTLLVNTPLGLPAFSGRFTDFRLAVIDATRIARQHGIGTRSVVIVNTTIAGAFARALGLPLEALAAVYGSLGFLSNTDAAREAHGAVLIREPETAPVPWASAAAPVPPPPVADLTVQVESAAVPLRTGNWRTQTPAYAHLPAPCNAFCPAGNDVIGFVQALAREGEAAAARVLARTTPLPAVCGRVCPAPCMEGCNRREHDGAVNIRGLERWVSDHAPIPDSMPVAHPTAHRVAIVGGGPAGLSAAYTLAQAGHRATIFDALPAPGGVLRSGIPGYRLPRDVLDREVAGVLALGVGVRGGVRLDAAGVARLAAEHDGLILATGLQRLRALDGAGAGASLAGVEQGIAFLARVNLGPPVTLGGHVVVLGGGNTAIDCARSALRAGAARVTIAYRRSRAEMPAIAEEIDEALHEGVALRTLVAPLGFDGQARVGSVRLAEVELGEPDHTGRRRPVVTDRVESLACDAVLLALGQSADLSIVPSAWHLVDGRFHDVDGRALPAFAAGDVATGDGTVTHALGDGRRAAGRLLAALGEAVVPFTRPDRTLAVPATDIRFDHFAPAPPARERAVGLNVGGWAPTNLGLPDGLEAHRCFSCGDCTQCDTCLVYCPEGIVRRRGAAYDIDYSYCKGCGICVSECPRKALVMRPDASAPAGLA